MSDDDFRYETFEIELQIRNGADVTVRDIKEILSRESLDFRVRKVESGDPMEAPHGHDIVWGDTQ